VNQLLIGAISDTHDNLPMVKKAIDRLNQAEVSLVLHAGDITSPFTPKMFSELKPPMIVTYGNNDAERELLKKRFTEIGKEVRGLFAEVEVDGVRVALTHGDEADLINSLIKTQIYHLIVCGHTHQQKSYASGVTTIMNPGEVCGYLTGESTAATIETKTRRVEVLRL
jgi:putative phosphoesterase